MSLVLRLGKTAGTQGWLPVSHASVTSEAQFLSFFPGLGNTALNSEFAHFGPRQLAPVLSFCYTVSPPRLEPSFACQIREEPTLGFCNSLSEVPGSAAPGWLDKSLQWVPGSAAAARAPA